MEQSTVLALSLFFHFGATVVWIGGLVITVILVWPEVRRSLENTPALYTVLQRLRKRFTPLSNLSLAVLIVTGLTQMSLDAHYDGFLDFANEWSRVILMKHIVIACMVISGLVLQYGVFPALERASLLLEHGKGDETEWLRLRRHEARLTWLNAILGIAVLGFSAWAGSL